MRSIEYRLPSRAVYFLLIFSEFFEVVCRIFLSYGVLITLLFFLPSVFVLQRASGLIDHSAVSATTQFAYAQEAENVLINGQIYSTVYSENEVGHLLDVRHLFFSLIILSIAAGVALFYFHLHPKRFSFYNRSNLLKFAAILITLFTLVTVIFFPVFFQLFHEFFFPQGNYAFSAASPLIQAFPPAFWLLTYLVVQGGVIILTTAQAVFFSHSAQNAVK